MPQADSLSELCPMIASLFRDSADAVVVADADKRVVQVNAAFERLFGYHLATIPGLRLGRLLAPAELARGDAVLEELTGERGARPPRRYSLQRKDASVFHGEIVSSAFGGEAGQPAGFLLQIRDISERVAAEAEAEATRLRVKDAIDSLQEGFALFDAEDRLVLCNRRYQSLYPAAYDLIRVGRSFEEIIRDTLARGQYDIGDMDPEAWVELRLQRHRNPPREHTEQRLSDGRWLSHTERRTAAGGIVGTRLDITPWKKLEQFLRRLVQIGAARSTLNAQSRIEAVLDLGRSYFELPVASVCLTDEGDAEVIFAVTPGDRLAVGRRFPLEGSRCLQALEADGPVALQGDAPVTLRERAEGLPPSSGSTYLGAPLHIDGRRCGVVSYSSPHPREAPFSEAEMEIMRLLTQWIGNEMARDHDLRRLERAREELLRLATTDELTGVHNRRELLRLGRVEFERWRRYGRPFSVLIFDIDRFKRINDGRGHEAGDRVLVKVTEALSRLLRATDVLGRLGGDEFVVLLPETVGPGARDAARRIAEAVRGLSLEEEEGKASPGAITLSIGIAECRPEDHSFDVLLGRADEALYEAKRAGRDRAVAA